MSKRFGLFVIISLCSMWVFAQSNKKDSVALRQLMNSDGEIKLNREAIKSIDFGTFIGKPLPVDEKSALQYDISLPKVFPEKPEFKLTLRPYTANTKYNYDPIYQKKINVKKDTWKNYDGVQMTIQLIPSNWAKKPFDPGIRKSVDEIEATGLRYNPLAGRANNMAVGAWGAAGGGGMQLDMMAPFTKDFWDKKGKKRRARTLEVLQHYGDSVTVLVKEEIKKAVVH